MTSEVSADVKDQLQGIKKQIKEKRLLIQKTATVEKKVSGELEEIDRNLKVKQSQLLTLGRDLRAAESALERTEGEIGRVKTDAEKKKQEIERRIASVYKAGEIGALRVFFSSESFPQMVENLRYMKSVLENDRKLFASYNARIEELKLLKARLEQETERKERVKSSVESKKQEIEAEKQKKATYLSRIKEDKKGYQASLKELQANAHRLQAMVEKLEARSRKSYTSKAERPLSKGGETPLPPVADSGFGSQRGRLAMPVRGEIIGRFGRHKHPEFNSFTVSNGISVAAPIGADIHSVYEGKVIFADYFKGYGNMVIVDHGGGYFSLYAHASRINKKVGSPVAKNETIASVGDSDSSKGPMLYMEIRYQGRPVDPAAWLR